MPRTGDDADRKDCAAVTPLSIVCWRWGDKYTAEHVNALRRMVERWYPAPHYFMCVTDDDQGLDDGIICIPDRADWQHLPSPHGGNAPSCYRRLRMFSPHETLEFGPRLVSLDLDCVIVGDMRPLWDRPDDVVLWRDPMYPNQANGSMLLLKTGSRPDVWTGFDPNRSPQIAKDAGFRGSDQAWLSFCLQGSPRWTRADGVYSFRVDCKAGLPKGARVVFFHGRVKPWDVSDAWVKENYR